MRLLILLVLFIVVPIAELWVIWQIGDVIGILPTLGLLLLDSILGTVLWRSQGRLAWRRFTEALQAGRPPAREVVDGVLVIGGGLLLLTPGFLSDIVGILMLLPPSRAVIRKLAMRRLGRRIAASMTSPRHGVVGFGPGVRPRPDADVEGTAVDVEPPGALGR